MSQQPLQHMPQPTFLTAEIHSENREIIMFTMDLAVVVVGF
jgi:hypothetical protein